MDDAPLMRGVERVRHVRRDHDGFLIGKRPAHDAGGERLPFQQLHDQKRCALVFANVVDRADIRVIERGRGARFAAQPLVGARVMPGEA